MSGLPLYEAPSSRGKVARSGTPTSSNGGGIEKTLCLRELGPEVFRSKAEASNAGPWDFSELGAMGIVPS